MNILLVIIIEIVSIAILSSLLDWIIKQLLPKKPAFIHFVIVLILTVVAAVATVAEFRYQANLPHPGISSPSINTGSPSQPSWVWISNTPRLNLWDIQMLSYDDGWIVGGWCCNPWMSTIKHWDGLTWENIANPGQYQLFTINMLNQNEGWAGGQFGKLLYYKDGLWQKYPSPTDKDIVDISMVSEQEGWAISNSGYPSQDSQILKYLNNEWQIYASGYKNLNGIDMTSRTDGWIVGGNGQLLHFDGQNWKAITSPTNGFIYRVQMLSNNVGWASGWDGLLLSYNNGVWRVVDSPSKTRFYSIDFVSPGEGWIAGDKLFHLKDGVWTEESFPNSSDTISAIDMIDKNNGWGIGLSDALVIQYR